MSVVWALASGLETVKLTEDEIRYEVEGQTELMRAVIAGEPVAELERVIEKNTKNKDGFDEAVSVYTGKQDSQGNVAAHYALYKRREPVVLKLLEVNDNPVNKLGLTPRELLLESRWTDNDGGYEKIYPDTKVQLHAEGAIVDEYITVDRRWLLAMVCLILWVDSFVYSRVKYAKRPAPCRQVVRDTLDMLLYIPAVNAVIDIIAGSNSIWGIGVLWSYLLVMVVALGITGLLLVPVMFAYNALLLLPERYHYGKVIGNIKKKHGDLWAADYMLFINVPRVVYYALKYLLMVVKSGDPVLEGSPDNECR